MCRQKKKDVRSYQYSTVVYSNVLLLYIWYYTELQYIDNMHTSSIYHDTYSKISIPEWKKDIVGLLSRVTNLIVAKVKIFSRYSGVEFRNRRPPTQQHLELPFRDLETSGVREGARANTAENLQDQARRLLADGRTPSFQMQKGRLRNIKNK